MDLLIKFLHLLTFLTGIVPFIVVINYYEQLKERVHSVLFILVGQMFYILGGAFAIGEHLYSDWIPLPESHSTGLMVFAFNAGTAIYALGLRKKGPATRLSKINDAILYLCVISLMFYPVVAVPLWVCFMPVTVSLTVLVCRLSLLLFHRAIILYVASIFVIVGMNNVLTTSAIDPTFAVWFHVLEAASANVSVLIFSFILSKIGKLRDVAL